MRKLLLISLATIAFPTTLSAQEALKRLDEPSISAESGVWDVEWSASAEQTFQLDYDSARDLDLMEVQDEGEYALGVEFSLSLPRVAELAVTPLITVNPHLFDDQDEASAWSVRTRLQRKIELTDAKVEGDRRPKQDELVPFVEYTYGQNYAEVFSGSQTASQSVSAGVTFVDVIGYLCRNRETAKERNCTGDPGTQYKVTLSYTLFDSEDDTEDRSGPKLAAELKWPFLASSSLWLDGAIEYRSYDSLLSDAGSEEATATHVTMTFGLDVSPWARRTLGLSDDAEFGIGARWVTVDGDRADLDRHEFLIVPTLSWKR